MKVIIMRHGFDRPGNGGERELSDFGRRDIVRHAEALAEVLSGPPTAIWSGPAKRARQTAELLGECLAPPFSVRVGIDECLSERTGVEGIEAAVSMLVEPPGTVLVGHNPSISEYYARYGSEDAELPDERVIGNGDSLVVTIGADNCVDSVSKLGAPQHTDC